MHIEFNNFIEEINKTTSTNDKVDIIRHSNKDIRKILYYTYNTFLTYGIKPKNLEKHSDLINKDTRFQSLFEILDSLNQRLITGHKAISEVNGFLYKNPELKELLNTACFKQQASRTAERFVVEVVRRDLWKKRAKANDEFIGQNKA